MLHWIPQSTKDVSRQVADFAKEFIDSRSDLHALQEFPLDIWDKLGREGLLGMNISREYAGLGRGNLDLAVAGDSLASSGKNFGVVLSWMIHHLTAGVLIQDHAGASQLDAHLSSLASGKSTAALAVSEPEAGAHPKYMRCRAVRKDGYFILNGEKTFLTNAPMANLFIVVAVTEETLENKYFSAFLVPASKEGLVLTPDIPVAGLKPSQHAGIRLDGCKVPADYMLGSVNNAYIQIVKPFRDLEDNMLMGPMVGGMQALLDSAACSISEKQLCSEVTESRFAELVAALHSARLMTYEAAWALDQGVPVSDNLALLLYCRRTCNWFLSELDQLNADLKISTGDRLTSLRRDLDLALKLASNVLHRKKLQMANSLLAKAPNSN